jgi:Ser/Thr protein kinase RdoA (MazF antagonist)
MNTSSSTPPYLPTYQVYLNEQRIKTIINAVFPDFEVTGIQQLESGQSYNNRIYFIDTTHRKNPPDGNPASRRFVLKLAGHYFNHRKIENELGCLLLLKRYCPEVPVPEVFAWSGNGGAIETVDGSYLQASEGQPFSDHPWILISRLPGRSLTVADLDSDQRGTILKQLAGHLVSWRTKVPELRRWGHLRLRPTEGMKQKSNCNSDLLPDKLFCVENSLFHSFTWPATWRYLPTSAADQLARLEKEPQFRWTWESYGKTWKKWVDEDLMRFSLPPPEICKLTHFDFSPRNVLVLDADGVLSVTGVLDFEFAGFFPPTEEFINALVRQDTDWEERHWDIIMREMANLGQKVPPTPGIPKHACFNEVEWKQLCLIVRIIDRMAPWEIMAGKFDDEELRRELEDAAKIVNEGMRELNGVEAP